MPRRHPATGHSPRSRRRGIEVDEVDPFGAVVLEQQGGIERRTVVGFASELALDEANGLSIGNVNGGEEF